MKLDLVLAGVPTNMHRELRWHTFHYGTFSNEDIAKMVERCGFYLKLRDMPTSSTQQLNSCLWSRLFLLQYRASLLMTLMATIEKAKKWCLTKEINVWCMWETGVVSIGTLGGEVFISSAWPGMRCIFWWKYLDASQIFSNIKFYILEPYDWGFPSNTNVTIDVFALSFAE